jgi:hypothetical protein
VAEAFLVEPDGEATHERCIDCDAMTRSVWGYVSNALGARAVYFIRWTDGHLERGAQLAVSIGSWGEGSDPTERRCIGFECRMGADRPGFMIADAADLPWGHEAGLGAKLTRVEALADPLSQEAFLILDALVDQDLRFRAFLAG